MRVTIERRSKESLRRKLEAYSTSCVVMGSLPFVVQPRRKPIIEQIGTEESGIIEIERRGYLTTGEKAFVQQVQQFDNGTTEIVTTSRLVARKYGLGMDKAYSLVLLVISGVDVSKDEKISDEDKKLITEIEQEFAEEITNVVKGLASGQVREDLVMAVCMLKYRVNENFDLSDINSVHPDIIEGLAALYRDEERRSVEAFEKEEQKEQKEVSIEEVEKKPSKTRGTHSKNTTGD